MAPNRKKHQSLWSQVGPKISEVDRSKAGDALIRLSAVDKSLVASRQDLPIAEEDAYYDVAIAGQDSGLPPECKERRSTIKRAGSTMALQTSTKKQGQVTVSIRNLDEDYRQIKKSPSAK